MTDEKPPFQPKQYWESRLNANWGLHGVGYLGLNDYNRWVYRVKGSVFDRTVRALRLKAGFTALDIGCGTGFFIDRWLAFGATSLTGMDLTETAVARLRATFPGVRFIQADIGESAGGLSERFDVISMIDVLFHIVDDDRYAAALRHIRTLLKPDGQFIFSEFFIHNKSVVGRHHVSRTLEAIQEMLAQAGFTIVSRKPLHVLMNQPLDTNGWMPNALWNSLTGAMERYPWLGKVAGTVLCPIDHMLVRVLAEGPSSEIMVCRRN